MIASNRYFDSPRLQLSTRAKSVETPFRATLSVRLSPDNARYVYVHAVALNSTGNMEQAIKVLQGAHNRFPNNTDILNALVAFHRDSRNTKAAQTYADKLHNFSP